MKGDTIQLSLSRSEALVLFEWLASIESKGVQSTIDEAEQVVLWGVESQLEKALHEILSPDYDKLLASAKRHVLISDE